MVGPSSTVFPPTQIYTQNSKSPTFETDGKDAETQSANPSFHFHISIQSKSSSHDAYELGSVIVRAMNHMRTGAKSGVNLRRPRPSKQRGSKPLRLIEL
ncbi:Hypothetical predicted protein [Olea europaea subsp. europaea]|uniref:Uncharacterized protein n=1 Tax=Olea europaea subsp. europaea TaxID=158383 RepID=A0A8S0TEB5_OLEEU|nr:Hypothetical predicted protein [Olea europaea subsp. europaea]